MSERHEKWTPVSPGTVIPAGQPYRAEWRNGSERKANERVKPYNQTANEDADWFIDSSWKPPLELPTEPTWGIALINDEWDAECWQLSNAIGGAATLFGSVGDYHVDVSLIEDFIPLTDEQVQRIEAAR